MRDSTRFLPDPNSVLDVVGFAVLYGASTFFAGILVGLALGVMMVRA